MEDDGTQRVFSALDNAKTQIYHFKTIVIAGMGFFTDAYDLFCITAVTNLLGRLYYFDPSSNKPGKLPKEIKSAVTGVALFGTLAGQLFFGWLGDKLGRKKVYGITLVTMVGCALASGLSFSSSANSVISTLCFFRFWLGFGIGGDYPLSAVIMSEYSSTKTRGAFVAAVFAMQGIGILFAGAISTMFSKIFLDAFPAPSYEKNKFLSTQPEADWVWRIILMFGAVPAALTFYWRMQMPETARYTALVAGNREKAAADMAKVLKNDFVVKQEEVSSKVPIDHNPSAPYGLISAEFARKHGLQLIGTSTCWFLLDIAFYSLNLTQNDIYPSAGLIHKASKLNALEEMFAFSKAMSFLAVIAVVPGYWFTVFLIDRIGRFVIQLGGFVMMTIFMAILGFKYADLRGEKVYCKPDAVKEYCGGHPVLFVLLYGLAFFFANFGPNSTTFIVPAELFPARFRATCHGISAASGKAGAILGAFVVQKYTQEGESGGIKKAILGLAAVNLLGVFFTLLVPETNGKSLEELSGEDKDIGVNTGATEASGLHLMKGAPETEMA